jgi:hypothetical protein
MLWTVKSSRISATQPQSSITTLRQSAPAGDRHEFRQLFDQVSRTHAYLRADGKARIINPAREKSTALSN